MSGSDRSYFCLYRCVLIAFRIERLIGTAGIRKLLYERDKERMAGQIKYFSYSTINLEITCIEHLRKRDPRREGKPSV